MTLKINKKVILEEFDLNPFKAYAKYKVKKDIESMDNGIYKPKPIPKDTHEIAQADTEGTWVNTMHNIQNHNNALEDAMKMLNH